MTIKEIAIRMKFGKAIKRWPISCMISTIISLILLTWIYQEDISYQTTSTYLRAALSLFVGFLVSIIIPLALGKSLTQPARLALTAIIAISAGFFWYYYLPNDVTDSNIETYWIGYAYPMQIIILHLLISVAAFWKGKTNELRFRNWNVKLLRVVLEGLLFSVVLMLGLSLALLALEHLFGFDINENPYLSLTVLLLGVFHPWFVLSNMSVYPNNDSMDENVTGFRLLTLYVLIPITILYMVILYLYGIKIGIEGALPKGWLGKLSFGFCGISLLTFVLNSQLKEILNSKFSRHFHKWLPIVLILPVVLLLIAIGRRIHDYGFTENRYLVAGIGIWLLIISLMYSFKKNLSIKWIPISLSILVILQLISGPLNIFKTSINSQERRLKLELEQEGILKDGGINVISNQNPKSIDMSSLRFLSNRIKLKNIPFLNDDNINWGELIKDDDQLSYIVELLNLQQNSVTNDTEYFYFNASQLEILDISGFDNAHPFNTINYPGTSQVSISKDQQYLKMVLNDKKEYTLSAYDLHMRCEGLKEDEKKMPLMIQEDQDFLLYLNEFSLEITNGIYKITQCSGMIFFNYSE